MRRSALMTFLLLTLTLWAQTPPSNLWMELEQSRSRSPGIHQEFETSVAYKTRTAVQASKWTEIIDMTQGLWRDASFGGAGDHVRIFDGKDTFRMEEGGDEFVRTKRGSKEVVIDHEGKVASAVEGDKGFNQLRNLLRKAGMDTD
jgi:hypothetical protein